MTGAVLLLSATAVGAATVRVIDARLVATMEQPDGSTAVSATTHIPYVVGRSCYTWVVTFTPVPGRAIWTEELVLPGPAATWGVADGRPSRVAPDRAAATTRIPVDLASGVATSGWCVAEGDPIGTYRLVVRDHDREVYRVDFVVGDPI